VDSAVILWMEWWGLVSGTGIKVVGKNEFLLP